MYKEYIYNVKGKFHGKQSHFPLYLPKYSIRNLFLKFTEVAINCWFYSIYIAI